MIVRREGAYVGTITGVQVHCGLPGDYRFCDLRVVSIGGQGIWGICSFLEGALTLWHV